MFSRYNMEKVSRSSPTSVTRPLKAVQAAHAKTEPAIPQKKISTRYSVRPNYIETIK